ncbi:putative eukaryotic initiation factor-2B, epsilon subunit [Toxoplasma gondii GT1]|uniref:Putative eukaryotic initiation factor-2B, epsilon subunit n=5 Tax=Toxoplasma gondii TaxID=5811 RepID=S7WC97_TOXGG|nr:putative eukaryotic initiation factor-2B, epsilon subunit [Toxoplasma gondii GT1]KAF4642096.1 putative eukaryotic initiation factor-2B, epsilon subunit [Toxoplasma gondii]
MDDSAAGAPMPGEEGLGALSRSSFVDRMRRVTSAPAPSRASSFVARALSAFSLGSPGSARREQKQEGATGSPVSSSFAFTPDQTKAASVSRKASACVPERLSTLSSASLSVGELPSLLRAFSLPEERLNFDPLAEDIPPALLPVCGVPLVVFALDFLARNGATDIFVLLKNNREGQEIQKVVQEQQPLLQRRFASRLQSLQILAVFVSPTVETLGDALRDFDSRVNFSKDFLLLSATTFIVGDIHEALASHRERRSRGRRTSLQTGEQLVTQILCSLPVVSPHRHLSDDRAIVLNGETKEVVKCVSLRSRDSAGLDEVCLLRAPSDDSSGHLEVHYDLVDAGVYICSPKVLKIFRYSFDFQSMTKDFIPAVVHRDIKLHAVFAHILKEKASCSEYKPFAAQVSDPRSYFAACQSVVDRWLYPIVPEVLSIFLGQAKLKYKGAGTYQADSVVVGSRSEVGALSVVEDSTEIGEDSSVRSSFLGSGCRIGKGVVVEGSILLDHVHVADGAVIRDSLLFPFASVKRGAEVARGCLLGKHVILGEERSLPPFTRIHLPLGDHSEKGSQATVDAPASSVAVVGGDGRGVVVSREQKDTGNLRILLTSPGASIAPAVDLPVPKFTRNPGEDESNADQLLSCATFPVSLKGLPALENVAVSSFSDGLDEKLFSLCLSFLRSSSFEEQQRCRAAVEEYLAAQNFFADKTNLSFPARHALRAFLFQLASLGATNPEVWRRYVAEHRVDSLFAAVLPVDHMSAAAFFPLWSECLMFCQQSAFYLPVRSHGSQDAAGSQPGVIVNPLYGPAAFCSVVETMQASDLLECEISLPLWFAAMKRRPQGVEGACAEYLNNPRLVAFCEWLAHE